MPLSEFALIERVFPHLRGANVPIVIAGNR